MSIKKLLAKSNKSGDDLINIVNSEFRISEIYLEDSLYDGLDIDYSYEVPIAEGWLKSKGFTETKLPYKA